MMDVAHARRHTTAVIDAVAEELYGLETVIKLSLAALLSGGHVLLEGNPGLGKTELVKRLAQVMNLKAGRIQFTPDLMPADITGTLMPTGNGGLRFQSGPIFTSLLLADEINRATPKTQSAMLEAMAEKKVTVLGEEHALPSPFVVLATQNPIDHEGTYNLPAAQADRFMFKVRMPVPDGPTVKRIVHKRAGAGAPDPESASANGSKADPKSYDLPGDPRAAESLVREISQVIRAIAPLPAVEAHVTNLFLATNRSFANLANPSGTRADIETAARRIQYRHEPARGRRHHARRESLGLSFGHGRALRRGLAPPGGGRSRAATPAPPLARRRPQHTGRRRRRSRRPARRRDPPALSPHGPQGLRL